MVKNMLNSVVLIYCGKRINFDVQSGVIKCKRIISSSRGGKSYPIGYFNEYTYTLNDIQKMMCCKKLNKYLRHVPLKKNKLPLLPPGASYGTLLRVFDEYNLERYYSDLQLLSDGSLSRKKNVNKAFLKLFTFFDELCDSSYLSIGIQSSVNSKENMQDERYFEETLWFCKKCLTGNLFKHQYCISCGEKRGW